MTNKPLVIYHGNCADGFSAAWAIWRKHRDVFEYYPGVYQKEPPNVTDRHVYMVDFSYKQPVIEKMLESAKSITVIDHHKTAEAELLPLFDSKKIDGIFDMEKSGAVLAWEWFHREHQPPTLLLHVQDRDLWKFELAGTREIQAVVFSYPYQFEIWDQLVTMCEYSREMMIEQGKAIERKHHKDIAELLKVVTRRMNIGGYNVPVANLPYTFVSDAAGQLAKGEQFAACYWDTPKGRVFGLRSDDKGVDVSEIAKKYGGGGHKNSAGFSVDYFAEDQPR